MSGTQTAALNAGGWSEDAYQEEVEAYDGTSWSEVSDLNTPRGPAAGCGIQTAALCMSGAKAPGTTLTTEVEQYDGSSWSEITDVNTARQSIPVGFGTVTAAIFCAGGTPSPSALTELWDGTSWTEVGDLPAGYRFSQGAGTQAAGLRDSGANPTPAQSNVTDEWTYGAVASNWDTT